MEKQSENNISKKIALITILSSIFIGGLVATVFLILMNQPPLDSSAQSSTTSQEVPESTTFSQAEDISAEAENEELAKEYFEKGKDHFRQFGSKNHLEEAIQQFHKAIELSPNNSEYIGYLGLAYSYIGNNEKALHWYTKQLEFEPNNAMLHLSIGSKYAELGNTDQAFTYYDQAIKLDPNNALFYVSKADLFDELGKYEEALTCYKKAAELAPEQYENLYRTQKTYNPNYMSSAAENPSVIIDESPSTPKPSQPIESSKEENSTIQLLKNAIAEYQDPSAYLNLAAQLLKSDRDTEGIHYLYAYIEMNPSYSAYSTAAVLLKDHGQKKEALKVLQKALQEDSSNAIAYKTMLQQFSE
ncbi:tetratricopeptide repeat protein [Clostridiaceae bacterium 35-E11]